MRSDPMVLHSRHRIVDSLRPSPGSPRRYGSGSNLSNRSPSDVGPAETKAARCQPPAPRAARCSANPTAILEEHHRGGAIAWIEDRLTAGCRNPIGPVVVTPLVQQG